MNELHLFSGAGGGILGGQLLGHRCICAVESEPYAQSVLVARQDDGSFPPFPIFPDVCTFDGRPWRGIADIVAGGFPCQNISVAGKGAGIDGEQSGLWRHMARIVGEVRPRFVFVENSPALLTRGLGRVLADLAALGYDCRWTVLGAADVGAPHQRDRFWLLAADTLHSGFGVDVQQEQLAECDIAPDVGSDGAVRLVAHADGKRELQPGRRECEIGRWLGDSGSELAHAEGSRPSQRNPRAIQRSAESERTAIQPERCCCALADAAPFERADWWEPESRLGRTFDGLAERLECPWADGWEDGTPRVATGVVARVNRLKAIGNGQVPLCAATAFRMLAAEFDGGPAMLIARRTSVLREAA